MNLPSLHRSSSVDDEAEAAVELPHVLITVAADGTLTATVDGTPFPSPTATAWTRATFGPLMDAITRDRTVAVRVEVRERDGSVFTDIIRARQPRRAAAPADASASETARSGHARREPRWMEVTARGFVPGEEVAVATIVCHTNATETGEARALIDPGTLPDGSGQEAILPGRISGTLAVRRMT